MEVHRRDYHRNDRVKENNFTSVESLPFNKDKNFSNLSAPTYYENFKKCPEEEEICYLLFTGNMDSEQKFLLVPQGTTPISVIGWIKETCHSFSYVSALRIYEKYRSPVSYNLKTWNLSDSKLDQLYKVDLMARRHIYENYSFYMNESFIHFGNDLVPKMMTPDETIPFKIKMEIPYMFKSQNRPVHGTCSMTGRCYSIESNCLIVSL